MMKLARTLFLSLSIVCAACGGSVEQPQTSATAATRAPIAATTHGLVKVVTDALAEVPLRPDQRATIEKLAQDAEARHAPTFQGRKELMLAFADQVEAGTIDRTALQPKIDRVAADLEKIRADDRAAIAKLHDLLDSEQRNTFVDALEAQAKARRGAHGAGDGELGPHARARGSLRHMKRLADDLKLTDEQRTKAREVMRDSFKDAMKQHMAPHEEGGEKGAHERHSANGGRHGFGGGKHALEAFREDKLDLDKVAPPHDLKAAASEGTSRAAGVAEKLIPILTPEQRKIAADKLRELAKGGDTSLLVH